MGAAAGLRSWADGRGLEVCEPGELRELTPALVTGAGGAIPIAAAGSLGADVDGMLCHHVHAQGGSRRESTIALTRVPESAAFVPALVCRDRATTGRGAPAQLPAERWVATELESTGFNRRYALLTLAGQDAGLVRELFSPSLIAWLEGEPPVGFSFELNEGHLTVALPGHLDDAAELERLCELAGDVAGRIRREIAEEGELDPDVFDESQELRDLERGLGVVRWDRPPASVQAAISGYRRWAARRPSVLLSALFWAVVTLGAVTALVALVSSPAAGLVAGAIAAPFGFMLGRLYSSARYRWGSVSVSRVGLESFVREYARARGLDLESRWRFHSDHRHLPLPGFADHVLAGELPGSGLTGRFVMLGDAAELRSRGTEMAFTSERPLASNAILVDAGREVGETGEVELPNDYRLEVAGSEVLVWRPVMGNLIRTAEGCDQFCGRAGEVVRRIV